MSLKLRLHPKLVFVLRLLITAAVLTVVFVRLPSFSADDVIPNASISGIGWSLATVGCLLIAFCFQTYRWQEMLLLCDVQLKWRTLFGYVLAGEFLSQTLPTSIGGDVLRGERVRSHGIPGSRVYASLVLELLTGWIVQPAIGLVALAISPALQSDGKALWTMVAIDSIALVGLTLAIIGASVRHRRRTAETTAGTETVGTTPTTYESELTEIDEVLDHPGSSWKHFLDVVSQGADRLRTHKKQANRALLAALFFQLALCCAFFCVAHALGVNQVSIITACAVWPPIAISQNLPVTISGTGIRESLAVLFLAPAGVSATDATACGLLIYILWILTSLFGIGPFLKWRSHNKEIHRNATATAVNLPDQDLS